jgi:hypothetical protein
MLLCCSTTLSFNMIFKILNSTQCKFSNTSFILKSISNFILAFRLDVLYHATTKKQRICGLQIKWIFDKKKILIQNPSKLLMKIWSFLKHVTKNIKDIKISAETNGFKRTDLTMGEMKKMQVNFYYNIFSNLN